MPRCGFHVMFQSRGISVAVVADFALVVIGCVGVAVVDVVLVPVVAEPTAAAVGHLVFFDWVMDGIFKLERQLLI